MITNEGPYAPPQLEHKQTPGFDADSASDLIKRSVARPAKAIQILAILNFAVLLAALAGIVVISLGGPQDSVPRPGIPEAGVLVGGLSMHAFQIFACARMRSLRSYHLAYICAITACVPCLSPFLVLAMPFGIWAVAVLNQNEVKQAFGVLPER